MDIYKIGNNNKIYNDKIYNAKTEKRAFRPFVWANALLTGNYGDFREFVRLKKASKKSQSKQVTSPPIIAETWLRSLSADNVAFEDIPLVIKKMDSHGMLDNISVKEKLIYPGPFMHPDFVDVKSTLAGGDAAALLNALFLKVANENVEQTIKGRILDYISLANLSDWVCIANPPEPLVLAKVKPMLNSAGSFHALLNEMVLKIAKIPERRTCDSKKWNASLVKPEDLLDLAKKLDSVNEMLASLAKHPMLRAHAEKTFAFNGAYGCAGNIEVFALEDVGKTPDLKARLVGLGLKDQLVMHGMNDWLDKLGLKESLVA